MEFTMHEEVWQGLPKSQLLRIVMQMLHDMGYNDTLHCLERESSCLYEDEVVSRLHDAILAGDMPKAKLFLESLDIETKVKSACIFLCSQQEFCLAVYNKASYEAVAILRDVLCPSAFDGDSIRRVHKCARLLLEPSRQVLEKEFNWNYETCLSRLWIHLQCLLAPAVTLPPRRLPIMLKQAVELQQMYCLNHVDDSDLENNVPNLICDHKCKGWIFPKEPVIRLEKHTDEVWDVAISPDGKYVASGSKDETIILWEAEPPCDVIFHWKGHQNVVCVLVWNQNSKLLASSGNDGFIVVWHCNSPEPIARIEAHTSVATSLAWLHGQDRLLSAGMDRTMVLLDISNVPTTLHFSAPSNLNVDVQYIGDRGVTPRPDDEPNEVGTASRVSCNGKMLNGITADSAQVLASQLEDPTPFTFRMAIQQRWDFETRIRSLAINYNGKLAIFATVDRTLHVWDTETMTPIGKVPETNTVSSVVCSKLFNQVLVSVSGNGPSLRLWDIDKLKMIQTYRGHKEDRFVLKAALGGPRETFVISGSEDSQVYIWNKLFGTLVYVIPAHSSTVNAVAWATSGLGARYIYSVSDDTTMAVWEPKTCL